MQKILEIIENNEIDTQDELVFELGKSRYSSYPSYYIKGHQRTKTC
jgi:hypothetical protein